MHFPPLKNPYKIRLFRCFTPTGAKIHFESLPRPITTVKPSLSFFVKFTPKFIKVCYTKNDFLTVREVKG